MPDHPRPRLQKAPPANQEEDPREHLDHDHLQAAGPDLHFLPDQEVATKRHHLGNHNPALLARGVEDADFVFHRNHVPESGPEDIEHCFLQYARRLECVYLGSFPDSLYRRILYCSLGYYNISVYIILLIPSTGTVDCVHIRANLFKSEVTFIRASVDPVACDLDPAVHLFPSVSEVQLLVRFPKRQHQRHSVQGGGHEVFVFKVFSIVIIGSRLYFYVNDFMENFMTQESLLVLK